MSLRTVLLLVVAVLALFALSGCYQTYPGDPVPDPNATRQKPSAPPSGQEATSGAVAPANRSGNREGR
jgi:predicted small lipoprotein YifL